MAPQFIKGFPMKELRCFIFNENEVISAVIGRRQRAREKLPTGTVKGITYDVGESQAVFANKYEIIAYIRIEDDHGKTSDVVVQTSELAAALIDYCLNRKIKMPKSPNRWVELIHLVDLTLFVTIESKSQTKSTNSTIASSSPISSARNRINVGTKDLMKVVKSVT